MKRSVISKEAMIIVKERAKYLGITQIDISRKLKVSLPTVKRWYSGSGLSLEIFKNICDVVGIPLSEVFLLLENNEGNQFQYTEAQELFFSKNPGCLTFFDYLIRGYSVSKIRKKFSMSTLEIEKNLSKLEKLELIDWLPNNKAKLKVKGEPIWSPGGPLSKTYRTSILDSFIKGRDKRDTSFYLHDYLEEDLVKIRAKIDELFDFLSRANKRAKMSPENTKSYGVYFSSKEFRWNMDHFLK